MTINKDEYFMQKALQEAEKAFEAGEIPVGAIITVNEKIIAKAHNLTELLHDVTAHAEIQAITSASEYLGGKYLKDCTLYVTLEPCVMCAGALFWARLGEIIYGAGEEKFGYRHYAPDIFPRRAKVRGGVLSEEAAELMRSFFATRR